MKDLAKGLKVVKGTKDPIKSKQAIFSMASLSRLEVEMAITQRYLEIREKHDKEVMELMIAGKYEEAMQTMDEQTDMEWELLHVLQAYDTGSDEE